MSTDQDRRVANIFAVYRTASAEEIREGLVWYDSAHEFAKLISPGDIARGAGIIAALSPLQSWTANMTQASRLVMTGTADGLGLRKNCDKAFRIYNGESPEEVLSGLKVTAFFRTILNPHGDIDPVIDRHAYDIAVGYVTVEGSEKVLKNKGVYAEFAMAYREAAKIAGIGASQMQAVVWVCFRRMIRRGFKVVAPASDLILAA